MLLKQSKLILLLGLAASAFAQNNGGSCPQGAVLNLGICANVPASINITPANPTVAVGAKATISANFVLADGSASNVATPQCQWFSSDPTIFTVPTLTPQITGVAAGSATLTCLVGTGGQGTSGGGFGNEGGAPTTQVSGTTTVQVVGTPQITNPNAASCVQPCPLPGATQNVAYVPTFAFTAANGVPAYTWTNNVGTPPTGMSLSSGGVLSGTPTVVGTTNWTVRVCDTVPNCTSLQVSIVVSASAACGPPPATTYCARSDTNVASGSTVNGGNPPAALMGLNGANSSVIDDMNSGPAAAYMLRVTDYAMVQARLSSPASNWFSVMSSSTSRATNCGTLCGGGEVFAVSDNGGAFDFFQYVNTSPPTSSYLGRGISTSNAYGIGGVEFSGTNPLLFYTASGQVVGGAGQRATLNSVLQDGTSGVSSWQGSHITATVVLDPINCPGLNNYLTGPLGTTWNKYVAHSGIADIGTSTVANPVVSGGYRYVQDETSLIVVYDPAVGGNHCRWLDMRTGLRGGDDMATTPTTGFGPLPPPTTPVLTSIVGALPCGRTYGVQLTYVSIGGGPIYAGESTPSPKSIIALSGTGNTCGISVTPPTANPGGGTGLNLTLTATGYNTYMCDQTAGPCTMSLQQNSAAPVAPVLSSVTGCVAGSNSYTFSVIAKNASGVSPPSNSITVNNVRDFAVNFLGCLATWGAVTGATSYDIITDGFLLSGNTTSTSWTINLGVGTNSSAYALQTTPIANTELIKTLTTGSLGLPTVNSAGISLHNIRIDPSGQWIMMSTAGAFSKQQGSAPQAPPQWLWHIPTATLIPCNWAIATAPYLSDCEAHWTHHNGTGYAVPTAAGFPAQPASVAQQTFDDNVTTMNNNLVILGTPNGSLDTQSSDAHFSGNYLAGPIFRTSYNTNYLLPSVPYHDEVVGIDTVNTNKIQRFCHIWTSGAQGFWSTPRGTVSQDGLYYIFESDMQKNANGVQGSATIGLGSFAGASTCTPGLQSASANACRYDVFTCQMK